MSFSKTIVSTPHAPSAIGPYSQAVIYGGLMFASGQIAMDPKTGEVVEGGIEIQSRQVMENIKGVLAAAGLNFSHILKVGIFLKNMSDFAVVNEIYGAFFDNNPPARSTVEVSRLPKDVLIEIEFVAAVPERK